MRLRRAGVVAGGLALLSLGVARQTAVVPDDAMAPSLLPGDLVLILPLTPRLADVVAVVDPLDPSVWTLRRVEGVGGAMRYRGGSFVPGDAPQLLDMGRDDAGYAVIEEGGHLTRHLPRNVEGEMDEVGVPDDRAFLGADNRDIALDSRWWGAVPLDLLQGRVVLRIGPPRNRWRTWFDLHP